MVLSKREPGATLDFVDEGTPSREATDRGNDRGKKSAVMSVVEAPGGDPAPSSMAVSIAGVSTACSKDALASSAKAVREALSTD
jgi:hypothetical protein